jgi:hypothetical protein
VATLTIVPFCSAKGAIPTQLSRREATLIKEFGATKKPDVVRTGFFDGMDLMGQVPIAWRTELHGERREDRTSFVLSCVNRESGSHHRGEVRNSLHLG